MYADAKLRESLENELQGFDFPGNILVKTLVKPVEMPPAARQRRAINDFMKARNLTVNGWASSAGVAESGLRAFLKGNTNSLNIRTLEKLAADQDVPVSVLLGTAEAKMPTLAVPPPGFAMVPEINISAGMGASGLPEVEVYGGDAVRDTWGLPENYVRGELRTVAASLRILDLKGDSMSPTLLDRDKAMIDVSDTLPSPPGIFAIWDGYGVIVKRIEIVPKSKPARLRVISDNPLHQPYEIDLEENTVVGRLRGFIRRF